MGSREPALRSLLESARGAEGLTVEQRQELLDHVEDAVESKVAAGRAELDAVAEAFRELGDLRPIASAFPRAWSPAALTSAVFGVAAMLALMFFATFVSPKAFEIASGRGTPIPELLEFLLRLGGPVTRYWALFLLAPPALGAIAWRYGGVRVQRGASFGFAALMMVALVGHLFGVTVSLVLR